MAQVNLTPITAGQVALASVVMSNFQAIVAQVNGGLDGSNLADNAVTTSKIQDNSVIGSKLAVDAVTTAKIKDDSVTTSKILNGAVTQSKLAVGAVATDNIINGAVTNLKIADGISAGKLVDNSLNLGKIAAIPGLSVLGRSDALSAASVQTITAAVDGMVFRRNGGIIGFGMLPAASISDNLITNRMLADDAVNTNEIVDLAVTTAKLDDGAVTTSKLEEKAQLTALAGSPVGTDSIGSLVTVYRSTLSGKGTLVTSPSSGVISISSTGESSLAPGSSLSGSYRLVAILATQPNGIALDPLTLWLAVRVS